jgi:hypothetical protein
MTETLPATVSAARRERINSAGHLSLVPPAEDGPPLLIALDFHFETNVRKVFRAWRRCMLKRALIVRDPAIYLRELEKHPNLNSPDFLADWVAAKKSIDMGIDLFLDLR